jgi:hypothetical protein
MSFLNPDWSYNIPGPRDLRLDWLRGYATMAMVIDHLGSSSYLHVITGGNAFFVSAAEAFVFISGMIVGLVYGDTLRHEGYGPAARKALLRAWTLYKLTVVLTIGFIFFVVSDNLPWASWLDPADPLEYVLGIVTLRRTFVFVDIPLMYTLLMLLAPLGLYFLRGKHGWLVLGASWVIWFAYQLSPIQQSIPTVIQGNWIFKLPAWQLLFFNAMVIGYNRDFLTNRLRGFHASARYAYYLLAGSAFAALIVLYLQDQRLLSYIMPQEQSTALLSALFDKSALAPGRLIAALIVFQFAFLTVTFFWQQCERLRLFIAIGQNSLYAYTMHIVLLLVLYAAIPFLPFYSEHNTLINTIAQLGAVLLIYWMIKKRFLFKFVPR